MIKNIFLSKTKKNDIVHLEEMAEILLDRILKYWKENVTYKYVDSNLQNFKRELLKKNGCETEDEFLELVKSHKFSNFNLNWDTNNREKIAKSAFSTIVVIKGDFDFDIFQNMSDEIEDFFYYDFGSRSPYEKYLELLDYKYLSFAHFGSYYEPIYLRMKLNAYAKIILEIRYFYLKRE